MLREEEEENVEIIVDDHEIDELLEGLEVAKIQKGVVVVVV